MSAFVDGRMTVEFEQSEVVIFLIGMKLHRWWKPWSWLPVALSMTRMLRELEANPDSGLLARRGGGPGVMVQYWRSFEDLVAYATDRSGEHYPAWAEFNRKLAATGDVGIWHETYLVPSDQIESLYNQMPPMGLGLVGKLVPAVGQKKSATQRLRGRALSRENR